MRGIQITVEWDFMPTPLSLKRSQYQMLPNREEFLRPSVVSTIFKPILESVETRYWLGLSPERTPMLSEVDVLFEDFQHVWREFTVSLFEEYFDPFGDQGPPPPSGNPALFRPGVVSGWPELISSEGVHLLGFIANDDSSALETAWKIINAAGGFFESTGDADDYLRSLDQLADIALFAPGSIWEIFSTQDYIIADVESELRRALKVQHSPLAGLQESWALRGK